MSEETAGALSLGAIVVAVLLLIGLFFVYNDNDHYTATVTYKDRTSDDTRIYTDNGTFIVADAYFSFWRTNSADVYSAIKVCHRYEFTTVGWRFGPTSSFPNIETYRDLGVDPECVPEPG